MRLSSDWFIVKVDNAKTNCNAVYLIPDEWFIAIQFTPKFVSAVVVVVVGGWTLYYYYQWRGSAETTFYWSSDFISGTRNTFIYKWKGERFENNKLNYNWTGDGGMRRRGGQEQWSFINKCIYRFSSCLPACLPVVRQCGAIHSHSTLLSWPFMYSFRRNKRVLNKNGPCFMVLLSSDRIALKLINYSKLSGRVKRTLTPTHPLCIP